MMTTTTAIRRRRTLGERTVEAKSPAVEARAKPAAREGTERWRRAEAPAEVAAPARGENRAGQAEAHLAKRCASTVTQTATASAIPATTSTRAHRSAATTRR